MENREEVVCQESKSVNNYILENQQITIDILMMAQEINNQIFGQKIEEPKVGNVECMLGALELENMELKEIASLLINIRNTLSYNQTGTSI